MTASTSSRQGCITQHTLTTAQGMVPYTANAQWQLIYEHDQPVAELFHVAYTVDDADPSQRPLTFVVNGGPGAASAYLHMGAMGPKRVVFEADGGLPKPPVQIEDNAETWLAFTDLVFIDPLGTGFSRVLAKEDGASTKAASKSSDSSPASEELPSDPKGNPPSATATLDKAKTFWDTDRDLKALGEFIQGYLSAQNRWLSPIFITGESYGGFRVAKLARHLQQDFGVGLNGVVIISPVLEFDLLYGTDYSLTNWAVTIPSMAAAAVYHGRVSTTDSPAAHAAKAEAFARQTLIPFLALGNLATEDDRQRVYGELAALIGLPLDVVQRHRGRVDMETFARELLRDQGRILGLYDASVTALDPFPNRPLNEGTDPTLDGLDRLFTGAINHHLRSTLGVSTPLTYHLLNYDVFKAWKFLSEKDRKQGFVGAVDDLRVAMALNPHMQVAINHGFYDLVTPYFSSNLLVDLMALSPELQPNLTLRHFQGGHMFYTWEASRQQWQRSMQAFYQTALA
ncbi:peptidase S10 [Leptolyngbya sp. BL0902]|uniref:S10 family peptidase n=1 Tax=Leptolyngbya sp. BL0902 TaxID=1115757 RepID=UPI0018E8238C|nr:peptidase S10 [Leptolyngbya sp. BL0902]QQE65601.1 peptidase S10 [Leptolyngbya sp. BL0902]